jgi:hypothetical protein
MLILAPSMKAQCLHKSINKCIQDHINMIFCGDIEFVYSSAMECSHHSQHTTHTSTTFNNTAQSATNSDQFHTAIAHATPSTSIAVIDNSNINIVRKLYTPPILQQQFPPCPPTSQQYSLPGDICDTIRHASKHKGAGVNADSIDLFINLVEVKLPHIPDHLNFIFNQIYQNNLPQPIQHYFTDVYLFCLHKDPLDKTKLRPLGIPTAIRCIIASHVAHTFREKLLCNYKSKNTSHTLNKLVTSHHMPLSFLILQINSTVSHKMHSLM